MQALAMQNDADGLCCSHVALMVSTAPEGHHVMIGSVCTPALG